MQCILKDWGARFFDWQVIQVKLLHAHWNLIVSFTSCHHQSKLENVAAKMFARYMEAGYSLPNGRCHGFGEKVLGFDHLEGPSHIANLPLWVILGRFQIVRTESLVVFGSFSCDWGMWRLLEMAFFLFHKEPIPPSSSPSVLGRPFWSTFENISSQSHWTGRDQVPFPFICQIRPYSFWPHKKDTMHLSSIDIIDYIRIYLMINL